MQVGYTTDAAATLGDAPVPRPPGLHWTLVLLLTVMTAGIFAEFWLFIQAWWVRRFDGSNKALRLFTLPYVILVIAGIVIATTGFTQVAGVAYIAALAANIYGIWSLKTSLEEYVSSIEGRTVHFSGKMTLIFPVVYLQYHMNRVRGLVRRV